MSSTSYPWNTPSEKVILAENEVHVWRALLEVPLSTINFLQQVLSNEEIERAKRFYFEKDRRCWTVARGVLRTLLGQYLGIGPGEVQFATNDYGKPSIAFPAYGVRLHFNLSHSGDRALYAFAYDRQVGIDVEYMRANIDCEALAKSFFSPYECGILQALPAAMQSEVFFQCWSRKEAYIKARGKGLSIPLDQFDVSLKPGEPAALLGSREDPQATARWSLHALAPGNDYAGTLVVEGSNYYLSCWQWQE